MPDLAHAASTALDLARARAATLGHGRLVCIDGPAGSGKTTLARELAALAADAVVVHLDDLYEGWDGLPGVADRLAGLLRPLAEGRAGTYRRWDWHAHRWAEEVTVPPCDLLVVEGVGAGAGATSHLVTVLVWVEAAYRLRMRRGIERDGDAFAPHWESWAASERAHFAAERTRERADLVVDGDGGVSG